MPVDDLSFGQRLRQERELRNFSQKRLAQALGTTVVSINRWEHNKAFPQAYYREQLCKLLGKRTEELFGPIDDKETQNGTFPLVWNVPYLRNVYFTGRESILETLHQETMRNSPAPYALVGLGGIGKTQVAVEYAYRYCDKYQAVLWVNAETRPSLISGFTSLAALLQLPEKDETNQARCVAAVLRWLQTHQQWLFLLDNLDDLEMVTDFLPTGSKGHILLTTRSPISGPYIRSLEIETLAPQEGSLLLLRRARLLRTDQPVEEIPASTRQGASQISALLDGLPLALDQAAAYIDENKCDIQGYLDLYRSHRPVLLRRRGAGEKREYPASVATTWTLCFEQIEKASPEAAHLLRLLAFLHPDDIPETLLTAGVSETDALLGKIVHDQFLLDETIGTLRQYSLIRRFPETKMLTIHRLVQATLCDSLSETLQKTWAEQAILIVNRAFPSAEFANWPQCHLYLPHVLTCAEHIRRQHLYSAEAAQLLNRTGIYLNARGQYAQAEALLHQALAIREVFYGQFHAEVAESLNALGVFYHDQRNYELAETLFQRALSIRESILANTHPDIAESLNALGALLYDQEKYEQAETYFQRALHLYEQEYGTIHMNVAQSLNNLATLQKSRAEYAQAEVLYQRVIAIMEQLQGPAETTHYLMAITMNNISALYRDQGRYEEAEPLCLRALTIAEETLGSQHLYVALNVGSLAKLYSLQKKDDLAEPLLRRALAIRVSLLGKDHPDVVITAKNLEALLRRTSRELEADAVALEFATQS